MHLHECLDRRKIEKFSMVRARLLHRLDHHRAQRPAQPLMRRNIEADLTALQHRRRQLAAISSFRITFCREPRILNEDGSVAANSMMR